MSRSVTIVLEEVHFTFQAVIAQLVVFREAFSAQRKTPCRIAYVTRQLRPYALTQPTLIPMTFRTEMHTTY